MSFSIRKQHKEYFMVPMNLAMNPNMSLEALGTALILLSMLEQLSSIPVAFLADTLDISQEKATDLLMEIHLSGHSLFETEEGV